MVQYGFYFDQSRCIGCHQCEVACKEWHQLPPGPQKWMRVYQWERGAFPEVRVHFLAIPCYHCAKPLCALACPNKAIFKEERYGAVLIDSAKCQGTRKCWQACPYGSIMFAGDGPGEKASKCTMCIDRLEDGKAPICVLSCSMRAWEFGPLLKLREKFGRRRELAEMPAGRISRPSAVFKPPQPKRQILSWDKSRAVDLWRARGVPAADGCAGAATDLFTNIEDLTVIPPDTIGRDRLVLKARTAAELMHYTTDDD